MTITRLRTLPTKSEGAAVDREARVIRGVSCAQAVEALGHGLMLDSTTLSQLAELGNAAKKGVKSRFTHPGLSSDGLGKYLGRLRDFRVEDDKTLADLYLSDLASKSPDGDLASYVMDMAADEPDMFGLSVVIDVDAVWQRADGSEIPVEEKGEDGRFKRNKRPDDATTKLPLARVKQFVACDVVDEPAANRDGMFSASLWSTNQLSEQMFGDLDALLAEHGIEPEKAFEFALKYFNARSVNLGEFAMADERSEVAQVDTVDLSALQEEMATMRAALAESLEAQQDAQIQANAYRESLDASNERVAALETAARNKRFADLSAEWFGTGHDAILVGLAEAFGEDSEQFGAYVQQQNAVAEQVMTSELLKERGSSRSGDTLTASDLLESKAQELMEADASLTHAQAVAQVADRNPDLYIRYKAEKRG